MPGNIPDASRFATVRILLCHVATGLLLTTGLFLESGLCMWVALVPWVTVVGIGRLGTCMAGSLLAGTIVGLVGLEVILAHTAIWIKSIWIVGSISMVGTSWMVGTLLARRLIRSAYPRLLAMLVAWFAFEVCLRYLSAVIIDGGIPLFQFGASQEISAIVRLASIGGLTAVGAFIVVVNWLVDRVAMILLQPRRRTTLDRDIRRVALAIILVTVSLVSMSLPWSRPTPPAKLRVGIVNVPLTHPHAKAALEQVAPMLDVVIFGESAFLLSQPNVIAMPRLAPGVQDSETGPTNTLWKLSKHWQAPVIIGAGRSWAAESPYRFVSAVLVTPCSGVHQAYDKRWLVAEIEHRPRIMRCFDRVLGRISAIKTETGGRADPFVLSSLGIRAGASICYDVYFSEPFCQYMQHADGSIDLAINCAGHEQLSNRADRLASRHVRFRAIETGRPIVHVAIAGTSCGFDAGGNEQFRIPGVRYDEPMGVAPPMHLCDLSLEKRNTLFSHLGPATVDLSVLLILLGSIAFHAFAGNEAHDEDQK